MLPRSMPRSYDALLLDLDGTLLNSEDRIHPATRAALREAERRGICLMLATGRSRAAAAPILTELGLTTRTVLFNGAAVYCPEEDRLVEERTFGRRTLEELLTYGEEVRDLLLVMTADRKLAVHPESEVQRRSLEGLENLELVDYPGLRVEAAIRVTFISDRHPDSGAYHAEIEAAIRRPTDMTHFPLDVLPRHRGSGMQAVDAHPPCRGKAEALRVLEEDYGIHPERVVAVGDANNDIPMVCGAGLGVAMGSGMRELKSVADRVIGHHDGEGLAELIEELFLAPQPQNDVPQNDAAQVDGAQTDARS